MVIVHDPYRSSTAAGGAGWIVRVDGIDVGSDSCDLIGPLSSQGAAWYTAAVVRAAYERGRSEVLSAAQKHA